MHKNYNLLKQISLELLSGPIEYPLTNDYMFKAVFQESIPSLTGLVSALLFIPPSLISVEVINPIELGKSIASKDFYLDLKVIVNNAKILNLEMQVRDLGNWNNRSLSYAVRTFDNLPKGSDYNDVKSIHHIGFTCFDLFKNNNKFYDTFMLSNSDNSQIYTDSFIVSVVNLARIDEASEKDKSYFLDRWCRLITATTWEELYMIAKEDPYMLTTAEKLRILSSDFDVQEEARRREEYYAYVDNLKATITSQASEISRKEARIAELEAMLADKNK